MTLDRFLHHAEIIQMTGRSYRLNEAANRPNKTKPSPAKPNELPTAGAAS